MRFDKMPVAFLCPRYTWFFWNITRATLDPEQPINVSLALHQELLAGSYIKTVVWFEYFLCFKSPGLWASQFIDLLKITHKHLRQWEIVTTNVLNIKLQIKRKQKCSLMFVIFSSFLVLAFIFAFSRCE